MLTTIALSVATVCTAIIAAIAIGNYKTQTDGAGRVSVILVLTVFSVSSVLSFAALVF